MRKIESLMCQAIANNQDWRLANTKVVNTSEGYSHVYLHNNHIATVKANSALLFDGGWQTVTTKSRLNAILDGLGQFSVGVFQQNWCWFVNTPRGGTEPFYDGFEIAW